LSDKQHAHVTHSTASPEGLVEGPLSADTDSVIDEKKFCQYCDKVIDDPGALVKHEAGHLTGFHQPVP